MIHTIELIPFEVRVDFCGSYFVLRAYGEKQVKELEEQFKLFIRRYEGVDYRLVIENLRELQFREEMKQAELRNKGKHPMQIMMDHLTESNYSKRKKQIEHDKEMDRKRSLFDAKSYISDLEIDKAALLKRLSEIDSKIESARDNV